MTVTMRMKTTLLIKTDKKVKKEAKKVAEAIGIPLGTILNGFLIQLARDKGISFSVHASPSTRALKWVSDSELDLEKGKVRGPFKTAKDLLTDLDA